MIDVTFIMNSYMEEIYSFKCCSLHGLNLEILIRNRGTTELEIKNYLKLEGENQSLKCDNLYPPYARKIKPDGVAAFYTAMDDSLWSQFSEASLYDMTGKQYRCPIINNFEVGDR